MNKLFKSFLLGLFITGSFSTLSAQDNNDDVDDDHAVKIVIPNFAILDIEPEETGITLEAIEPTEAGTALNFSRATDESLWLNYSSIVASEEKRAITVEIDGGGTALPKGLILKVTADEFTGVGKGKNGTAAAQITLSEEAQTIVSGIGSCYTGDETTNGHKLTYELSADDENYENIVSSIGTKITIVYTFTE